jgi:hypothetical protein
MKLESHIHALGNVRKCEKMNPHTLKWAPTLEIRVSMDSKIFRRQVKGVKTPWIEKYFKHWKALGV